MRLYHLKDAQIFGDFGCGRLQFENAVVIGMQNHNLDPGLLDCSVGEICVHAPTHVSKTVCEVTRQGCMLGRRDGVFKVLLLNAVCLYQIHRRAARDAPLVCGCCAGGTRHHKDARCLRPVADLIRSGAARDAVFRRHALTVQIAATIRLLFYSLLAS